MKTIGWFFTFFSMALAACEPVDLQGSGTPPSVTIINNTQIVCIGADGQNINCTDADGDGRPAEGSCIHSSDGVGTCMQGLRPDCDDNNWFALDPNTPEVCDGHDQSCPGEEGYGEIDEGLDNCCTSDDDCEANEQCNASNACEEVPCPDDGDACTDDVVLDHINCTHPPVSGECCTSDNDCDDGELCTSNTATVAGVCLNCDDMDVCTADTIADGVCANTAISGCCTSDEECSMGVCTSNSPNVPGTCVGCADNNECFDNEQCDLPSHACEEIVCPPCPDICIEKVARNHQCEPVPISLCCHGADYDWECDGSRPTDLPPNYRYGCRWDGSNRCGECVNNDNDDGCYTGPEYCGPSYEGWDDNANGSVDEGMCVQPPVVSPDAGVSPDSGSPDTGTPDSGVADSGPIDRSQCPATGVGVINLTSLTIAAQIGRTFLPTDAGSSQIEGPDSFSPEEEKFDSSATGMWLWPRPDYNAWAAMTSAQKLQYCTDNFRGRDRCGIIFLPRLTASGDCEFPMDP